MIYGRLPGRLPILAQGTRGINGGGSDRNSELQETPFGGAVAASRATTVVIGRNAVTSYDNATVGSGSIVNEADYLPDRPVPAVSR